MANVEKPYTRRGVLSTIYSLFDLIGFAALVSVQGRKILRNLTTDVWDAPLPEHSFEEWQKWCTSLKEVKIPRVYTPISFSQAQGTDVCVFCDASTEAVTAVAYLKDELKWGFGKMKLAPKPEITIPRV